MSETTTKIKKLLPTSFLVLFLFLLLTGNGFFTFYIRLPFPPKCPPEPASFSPEFSSGDEKISKSVHRMMYVVKEENPAVISNTHLPILKKVGNLVLKIDSTSIRTLKRVKRKKPMLQILKFQSQASDLQFSVRIKEFLANNGANSSCKVRFFMTWISSLDTFGERELFSIESVFKSHPDSCLILVSKSMDSIKGVKLLNPFVERGFRVTAISPDFDFIFKDTFAESWFNRLKKGHVNPGDISLGQNLSNLLRLALLYKFGGIYIDTDVLVLKNLGNMRNVIGAQTMNLEKGNWSRLNNAVMIFDKKHPLLYRFIEEFALTFNGNKWGHNGPYLVSRVVRRVENMNGFEFTVLPPSAFYPVDWSRIHSLFHAPRDENITAWMSGKLSRIRKESFAVHLWNRQSRKLKIEDGSIIGSLLSDCCVFGNSLKSSL